MKPKILNSIHLRLTIIYCVVFGISVGILATVVYLSTQEFLDGQMRRQVELTMEQLIVDYDQDGLEELRHDTKERVEQNHPHRLWFFLSGPDGTIEFDPIASLPEEGWHEISNPEPLLLKVRQLKDGYRFGVAMGFDEAHALERAVRNAFVVALLCTILLGACGGYLLSRRFLSRVELLKTAAEKIGEGNLSLRMPVSARGDDFDQLAVIINRMLEQIESLVKEVQNVSTNIAHDLRTPIGRIRQKLETLGEKGSLDEDSQKLIEQTICDLDETLETFSGLLRIAEIQSGVRRAGFAPVNISELLEMLVSTYEPVAEAEGTDLKKSIPPNIYVRGDRSLLTQMFVNLIENSLQHTPAAGCTRIDLKSDATQIQVSVSDQGQGIPASLRSQVLKPFFKADSSRSKQGSGLGLSLVSAIAKLHSANIELQDANPGLRVVVQLDRSPS